MSIGDRFRKIREEVQRDKARVEAQRPQPRYEVGQRVKVFLRGQHDAYGRVVIVQGEITQAAVTSSGEYLYDIASVSRYVREDEILCVVPAAGPRPTDPNELARWLLS